LQLSASFGEMMCPFLMGIAFQFRKYWLFYGLMFGWETFVFVTLFIPWALLTRRVALPATLFKWLAKNSKR
jgi:hypothetical protein